MSFNTALSGLNAASADLNVKSNNIANVNTTGFKESRAEFADVFAVSAFGSSDTAIGNGTVLNNVAQQFNQGNLEFTDNALDLSISGQGFFALSPNETSIEEMVGRLQVGAVAAVTVMNEGRESAKNSVEKAAQAATALDSITAMISKMDEMSAAISNAASEQSAVAEDINRGIVKISQVAEHTAEGAHQSSEAVSTMSSLSEQLQEAASK